MNEQVCVSYFNRYTAEKFSWFLAHKTAVTIINPSGLPPAAYISKQQFCPILKDCLCIFQDIQKLRAPKITEHPKILLRLVNLSRNTELNWEKVRGDHLTHLVSLPRPHPMYGSQMARTDSEPTQEFKTKCISQTCL